MKQNLRNIEMAGFQMNVLEKIRILRLKRNWTEYQLAEKSGLRQSTISTWYRKNMFPTIPSLEKICAAFNMSLAQFFTDENESQMTLTEKQTKLIENFNRLCENQQDAVLQLLLSI